MRGRLRPMVAAACVALAVTAAMAGGCASGSGGAGGASGAPTAGELASLTDVATSTVPGGVPVAELITIAEVKDILGRDDIYFAENVAVTKVPC